VGEGVGVGLAAAAGPVVRSARAAATASDSAKRIAAERKLLVFKTILRNRRDAIRIDPPTAPVLRPAIVLGLAKVR